MREFKNVRFLDISFVLYPANSNAVILSVKDSEGNELNNEEN